MVNPFIATSKDYTNTPTLNSVKTRLPFLPREKAAIIKLCKLGYSINSLKTFFGRSTSVIHRIVKLELKLTGGHRIDLRKLPAHTRLMSALKTRLAMDFQITRWMPFILGDEAEPP